MVSKSQSCTRTLIYVHSERGKQNKKTKQQNNYCCERRKKKKKKELASGKLINLHSALNMCSDFSFFVYFPDCS